MLMLIFAALAQDPYRPPAVPDPMPAEALPSPYEDRMRNPAVDVATRVVLQSNVAADLPGLAAGATAADALALQLAADPRWRVVDWEGGRVAYVRVADGKEWTVPLRGYHANADGVWRTAIVLRPWGSSSVWATSPMVGHAAANATSIAISRINYEGDPEWRAVAWEWGDPGATLEVFEAGPRAVLETLPYSNEALSTVPNLMSRVAAVKDDILAHGFTATMLPGREVRRGEPTVSVKKVGDGELEVRAWVHTPGPGVTWARILDTDLRVWEEPAVAAGTREILGYSDDKRQLFYMQGRFPVPAGEKFSGTIEVWHQADGGAVTRLAATPVTIPGR